MQTIYPVAALLLRVHELLQGEWTQLAMGQMLGISPSSMEHALTTLKATQLLTPCADTSFWSSPPDLENLIPNYAEWQQADSPMVLIVQSFNDDNTLEGCRLLMEHLNRLLGLSQAAGAVLCLRHAIRLLQSWQLEENTQDSMRKYIALALDIADISMYLTKYHGQAQSLTQTARQAARALGDKRSTALLFLVGACLENMAAECSAARMQELHAQCEAILRELDDEGMLLQTAAFMGTFAFWSGDFHRTLSTFDDAQKLPQIWQCRFQTGMFPLYTSSSAVYLGKAHLAVGILESAKRAAELAQDQFKTLWWEAQLAMVLLYINHCEKALELIDHVISEADPVSETKILLWGMRGLAYYHYLQGHIESSHAVMDAAMNMARSNGFKRPIYSYPWMLDMLLTYEIQGLHPIIGLNLDEELQRGLEGFNKHLRASALRTSANRLSHNDPDNVEVLPLLHKSLKEFAAVGNPAEVARTKQHITMYVDGITAPDVCAPGDRQKQSPHKEELHTDDKQNLCDSNTLLENCKHAMDDLYTWTAFPQFLNQITRIASCELGAERAALFQVEHSGIITCRATCNISDIELKAGQLVAHVSRLQSALSAAPLLLEDTDVILMLPLQVSAEDKWILYLESRYSTKVLRSLPPQMQSALASQITQELRTAIRIKNQQRLSTKTDCVMAEAVPYKDSPERLFHSSHIMRQVLSYSRQTAMTDAAVLILGETGVGKELLARYIHESSGRSGPFVPVHPASISQNLFESEFFGHEKGSFTGAHKQKIGLAEMADKGTLFIDEVADIPIQLQVKLLRVFQNKNFIRVGGSTEISSDFRIVGATNKDLWQEVQEGRFREDLYYRMAVVPLLLPPLRERKEDILVLLELFMERFSKRYHRNIPPPSPEDLEALLAYSWPGNVRELKSVVERAVILHNGGKIDFILESRQRKKASSPTVQPAPQDHTQFFSILPTIEELQCQYIVHVLALTHGKITGPKGALSILDMKRSSLYAKIKQYGIQVR